MDTTTPNPEQNNSDDTKKHTARNVGIVVAVIALLALAVAAGFYTFTLEPATEVIPDPNINTEPVSEGPTLEEPIDDLEIDLNLNLDPFNPPPYVETTTCFGDIGPSWYQNNNGVIDLFEGGGSGPNNPQFPGLYFPGGDNDGNGTPDMFENQELDVETGLFPTETVISVPIDMLINFANDPGAAMSGFESTCTSCASLNPVIDLNLVDTSNPEHLALFDIPGVDAWLWSPENEFVYPVTHLPDNRRRTTT